MMYDDVVLASQVIAMSLYRLWGDQSWDQVEWGRLTESIADGAFSKVYKIANPIMIVAVFQVI